MAIVNPTNTDFLAIPIPGEDSDPFYDQFVNYTLKIEQIMFYRKMFANMFISGGGTRIWSSGTGVLTWTEDFVVPVFHWGRAINVVYGPGGVARTATIPNGSGLVIEVPAKMNANVNRNFSVVSQLNTTVENQWVAGWNNDGTLQLRGMGEFT